MADDTPDVAPTPPSAAVATALFHDYGLKTPCTLEGPVKDLLVDSLVLHRAELTIGRLLAPGCAEPLLVVRPPPDAPSRDVIVLPLRAYSLTVERTSRSVRLRATTYEAPQPCPVIDGEANDGINTKNWGVDPEFVRTTAVLRLRGRQSEERRLNAVVSSTGDDREREASEGGNGSSDTVSTEDAVGMGASRGPRASPVVAGRPATRMSISGRHMMAALHASGSSGSLHGAMAAGQHMMADGSTTGAASPRTHAAAMAGDVAARAAMAAAAVHTRGRSDSSGHGGRSGGEAEADSGSGGSGSSGRHGGSGGRGGSMIGTSPSSRTSTRSLLRMSAGGRAEMQAIARGQVPGGAYSPSMERRASGDGWSSRSAAASGSGSTGKTTATTTTTSTGGGMRSDADSSSLDGQLKPSSSGESGSEGGGTRVVYSKLSRSGFERRPPLSMSPSTPMTPGALASTMAAGAGSPVRGRTRSISRDGKRELQLHKLSSTPPEAEGLRGVAELPRSLSSLPRLPGDAPPIDDDRGASGARAVPRAVYTGSEGRAGGAQRRQQMRSQQQQQQQQQQNANERSSGMGKSPMLAHVSMDDVGDRPIAGRALFNTDFGDDMDEDPVFPPSPLLQTRSPRSRASSGVVDESKSGDAAATLSVEQAPSPASPTSVMVAAGSVQAGWSGPSPDEKRDSVGRSWTPGPQDDGSLSSSQTGTAGDVSPGGGGKTSTVQSSPTSGAAAAAGTTSGDVGTGGDGASSFRAARQDTQLGSVHSDSSLVSTGMKGGVRTAVSASGENEYDHDNQDVDEDTDEEDDEDDDDEDDDDAISVDTDVSTDVDADTDEDPATIAAKVLGRDPSDAARVREVPARVEFRALTDQDLGVWIEVLTEVVSLWHPSSELLNSFVGRPCVATTRDLLVVGWNFESEQLFGWAGPDAVDRMGPRALVPPLDREERYRFFSRRRVLLEENIKLGGGGVEASPTLSEVKERLQKERAQRPEGYVVFTRHRDGHDLPVMIRSTQAACGCTVYSFALSKEEEARKAREDFKKRAEKIEQELLEERARLLEKRKQEEGDGDEKTAMQIDATREAAGDDKSGEATSSTGVTTPVSTPPKPSGDNSGGSGSSRGNRSSSSDSDDDSDDDGDSDSSGGWEHVASKPRRSPDK